MLIIGLICLLGLLNWLKKQVRYIGLFLLDHFFWFIFTNRILSGLEIDIFCRLKRRRLILYNGIQIYNWLLNLLFRSIFRRLLVLSGFRYTLRDVMWPSLPLSKFLDFYIFYTFLVAYPYLVGSVNLTCVFIHFDYLLGSGVFESKLLSRLVYRKAFILSELNQFLSHGVGNLKVVFVATLLFGLVRL